MKKALFYTVLLSYMAAVVFVSVVNVVPPQQHIPWADKLYHLGAYTVMGLLWARLIRLKRYGKGGAEGRGGADLSLDTVAIATAITFSFGVMIEIVQAYLPERDAELGDAFADGFGGMIGSFVYERFLRSMDARP